MREALVSASDTKTVLLDGAFLRASSNGNQLIYDKATCRLAHSLSTQFNISAEEIL